MLEVRCNGLSWYLLAAVLIFVIPSVYPASKGQRVRSSPDIPITQFTCTGRPPGYYADTETGCQVYHMCTEGGNQFSYKCPNTTLFQQRMLICAHWYQVNCSRSEQHYANNLLIGQKDKPFVNDDPVLSKEKQLKTLQNPEILQSLGQNGREGTARQGKSQPSNENVPTNRIVQNNFKRDGESSFGTPGRTTSFISSSPRSRPDNPVTVRRISEDLSSLPLAGSVLPGGLKSVHFSKTASQGLSFGNQASQTTTFPQQKSTSTVQFLNSARLPSQKATQPISFVPVTPVPNSVQNSNIFATTKSPQILNSKFSTENQNKFQPSGFKKQPLPAVSFTTDATTSEPSFEFLPPSDQQQSIDLAVASQENPLSGRRSTTPEPSIDVGGSLPETDVKAEIEQTKNGSLPDDRYNTFIKRFNPYEEPSSPTLEPNTNEPDTEYHTFINRFVPDEGSTVTETNIRRKTEDHVFINRFVLTPDEIKREKDRVQVDRLHNLLPPEDHFTVSFPNFDLMPPLDDSSNSESNKIELLLQDPRRAFFIPNEEDNEFSKADAAPIVVTIPLHSHEKSSPMWFRTDESNDSCARCHPSFLVNKETCMPCVIIR